MGQYYFTVGSLPMLFFGDDTGPDTETFRLMCAEACSKKDLRLLEQAKLTPSAADKSRSRVVSGWNTWETALRNELVRLRGKEKGKDAERDLRELDTYYTEIQDIAREAYNQDSPLQAEEVLNQARWRRLEELETGHHFDMEKLVVYYLKLQLKERKAMFSRKNGEEKFSRVYETVKTNRNRGKDTAGEDG